MSWILEYFVVFLSCVQVYIYIGSAGYVELPIVLLHLLRCLVYHMLSKTRRNSRSLQSDSVYVCSAGYAELPIVLLYLLRCLVYHMPSKTRRNSRSLHRVMAYMYVRLVMPSYLSFCCIYFDAWCITCCSKREETLEVYTVIGEVLVLGVLVVYKIPNSIILLVFGGNEARPRYLQ